MGSISFDEFVLHTVAVACRLDPSAISARTSLLDIPMDSLTFVAILSQIEAVYGADLSAADTLDLLRASDIGGLITSIERTISRQREILDESAGNTECTSDRT